jgi:selenocysteine lyase/cysteine desulfurase
MIIKPQLGRPMRETQFAFSPTFTPLNHGSFGAYPRAIQEAQNAFQKQCHKRPDTFIVYDLPVLINKSRKFIAHLLGVDVDEVVFVPNATTGVNTVLRNLK